jgi:phage terminase large subunit-like protein
LFSRVKIETNKGEALFTEIKRTTSIPVVGIHETRDKTSRFIGQSAKFENGKVYISMLIPESIRGELVDQITTNNPPHDDMRDALLLAIEETKRELFIG